MHYAIAVNQDCVILDGHNRFRACNELGIKPKIQIFRFNNELEERKFIIDTNVKRRQLTDYQRYKYAQELKKIHAELKKQKQTKEAAEYGKLGGRGHKKEEKEKDQEENEKPLRTIVSKALATKKKTRREKTAAELAAEEVGWSYMTLQRAEKIETEGNEEEKKQFIEGKKAIWAISKDIEDRKKREELIKSAAAALSSISSSYISSTPDTYRDDEKWLMLGDFRERCREIPDKSVPLVLSDPPYDNKNQILYQYAGEVANDKLVDQGSLVVYAGHYAIRDVIDLVLSKAPGLRYLWIIAVKQNGGSCAMGGFHIWVRWKPMVWFVKGKIPNIPKYIDDLVESTPPDKSFHKMAQSMTEAEYVISHMTIEGQTVLDPMMGSGVTGVSALKLGRKFIGVESNDESYEVAKANIIMRSVVLTEIGTQQQTKTL